MWHYLYFIVLIKVKDPTEFTGPESYVHQMVKVNSSLQLKITIVRFIFSVQERCLDWFPRLRAISLAAEEVEGEQNEWRTLQTQLGATQVRYVQRERHVAVHVDMVWTVRMTDMSLQELVKTLSTQLSDLRDQMTEQRKQKQRIGLLTNAPSLLNLGNTSNGVIPHQQQQQTEK